MCKNVDLTRKAINNMKYKKEFVQALMGWKERAEKIAEQTLGLETGRKYLKILSASGSVFCFIEISTGDVLKAASWRAPAKHARGSIYEVGKEGVNKYGANYLTN